jgi:hypothetical protein
LFHNTSAAAGGNGKWLAARSCDRMNVRGLWSDTSLHDALPPSIHRWFAHALDCVIDTLPA